MTRTLRSQGAKINFVSLSAKKLPKRKFVSTATPATAKRRRFEVNDNNDDFEVPAGTGEIEPVLGLELFEPVDLQCLTTEEIPIGISFTIVETVEPVEPFENVEPVGTVEHVEFVQTVQNASINSIDFELVGGDVELNFEEETVVDVDNVAVDPTVGAAKKRKCNKLYKLKENFEDKENFDVYWKSENFSKNYFHYSARPSKFGEEEIFKCKFAKKVGYKKCENQLKIIFPGANQSVQIYESVDEHSHVQFEQIEVQTFSWKNNDAVENIVVEGVRHNDVASKIFEHLEIAGISPLPTMGQLNNKIAYLRKTMQIEMQTNITTSGELREALDLLLVEPEDTHKPYVNSYKIEILSCGTKARFWFNLTTTHLLERYKNNPQKLFQIDGTYKLIWVPDKSKEGHSVQVHGTSNILNEFYSLVCV